MEGAATAQDTRSPWDLEEAGGLFPWSPWREYGPAGTSVSDIWLPECERMSFCCLKLLVGGPRQTPHIRPGGTSVPSTGISCAPC